MNQRARIPTDSIVFGYGPMLPLVAAGIGAWVLAPGWGIIAVRLAIVWGGLILSFIGGVRRGFGFAAPGASTLVEIVAAVGYVTLAALLDRRAALAGNAPAHFARLRPPQLLLGCAGLAACWAWVMLG